MKKINKYITATILTVVSGGAATAQTMKPTPKLVVNITIDQLRADYMEAFSPLYTLDGFKKLVSKGLVFTNAAYPFVVALSSSPMVDVLTLRGDPPSSVISPCVFLSSTQ